MTAPTEEGTVELKACPFCGNEPRVAKRWDESIFSHASVEWWRIVCDECGCESMDSEEHDEVFAAWNRRASRSPVVGAVGGEPTELETLQERYEFILSACREAQSIASARGWALDSILRSSGYECESYTTGIGSCFTNGRTPEAQYGADRCCHSCIAAKGLGVSPTGSPEGEVSNG